LRHNHLVTKKSCRATRSGADPRGSGHEAG
jgi:hypothetical protein